MLRMEDCFRVVTFAARTTHDLNRSCSDEDPCPACLAFDTTARIAFTNGNTQFDASGVTFYREPVR